MAIAKKNFFKDHYDWLVAAVGLALLVGVGALFATSLDNTPEAARAACESELKQRTPAYKNVPSTDEVFRKLEAVQKHMASPSLLAVPSDTNGCFLASERRVFCKKCRNPISVDSKICEECKTPQQLDEATVVRGGIDTDQDGMPDAWERKYGLNPYDPADAKKDLDGDTFTNLEEYEAKTDPTNPDDHPDFLEFLALASSLRTEELPFLLADAIPVRNSYRLKFVAAKRNQEKKPVIGDAVVKANTTAEIGQEVVFELMKIKYVKGRAQDDKVKTGWRVLKYNKEEKLVDVPGSDGLKKPKNVSTAELERISDKRTISVQILEAKPVAIEEQIDLVWNRGDGKPFTVTKGKKFKLKNREYEVKKLAKDGNACKVTILDLETKKEKIIQ